MKSIILNDILLFHQKIIQQTGGSDGIRDLGLIESALSRAFTTFDGKDLYKEVDEKVAVITHGLIKNHGFIDGNKRIGIAVMVLLLKLNNIYVNYTQKELVDLGLGIANGIINEIGIKNWIRNHQV